MSWISSAAPAAADEAAGVAVAGGGRTGAATRCMPSRNRSRSEDAYPVEGISADGLGQLAARLAGNGRMIQTTAQMRVLVAIEPIDVRKGLTHWRGLCQDKLSEDPFSGCVFVFRSRHGTAICLLSYDGQ